MSYTDRIWSYSTRQSFFNSSDGIQNYGYSVVAGVVDIDVTCPNYPPARLGVAVHELVHQWGLPDILSSAGDYDVMGNMWGSFNDQENVAMGAVSKYFMNWLDVIEITSNTTVSIEPSCTSNKVYMITHNLPDGEFFLVRSTCSICIFGSPNLTEYRP